MADGYYVVPPLCLRQTERLPGSPMERFESSVSWYNHLFRGREQGTSPSAVTRSTDTQLFDNRLNVCIHDTAGCQTGCQTAVLNEQHCSFNRLSNRQRNSSYQYPVVWEHTRLQVIARKITVIGVNWSHCIRVRLTYAYLIGLRHAWLWFMFISDSTYATVFRIMVIHICFPGTESVRSVLGSGPLPTGLPCEKKSRYFRLFSYVLW